MNRAATISFTTDFGTRDGYIGVVKGVIRTIAPDATVIDISHEIQPWDLRSASWLLGNSCKFFPAGTVHLAVVDPGVGTERTGIIVQSGDHIFVAPDNGLLTPILDIGDARVWEISNSEFWLHEISSTFHARDIFGPVAAHLAAGRTPDKFGKELELSTVNRLSTPQLSIEGESVIGEVVYIDRFGNLITNISASVAENALSCALDNGAPVPFSRTYGSVQLGAATSFIGSHGSVEIAVNQGDAAKILAAGIGAKVHLHRQVQVAPQTFDSRQERLL